MNVEIGAEAALFPEKEYISGILACVVVRSKGVYNTYTKPVKIKNKVNIIPYVSMITVYSIHCNHLSVIGPKICFH
jgi:hypothetical protein